MSGPELSIRTWTANLVELAAHRGRGAEMTAVAAERDIALPSFGHASHAGPALALCVRPERWLLLTPAAEPGVAAAGWHSACAGRGVAIDQSSGWVALMLSGPAVCKVLVRSCRLDLSATAFPAGCAAACVIAQVAVTLAALPQGLLLLTPATTARHLREWLAATAQIAGVVAQSGDTVADWVGGIG